MESANYGKRYEALQIERRKLLLQTYILYLMSTVVSTVVVSFMRENISARQIMIQVASVLLMTGFLSVLLYFTYKKFKDRGIFDTLILMMNIMFYILMLLFSNESKTMAIAIIFPIFLFFVLTTMSRSRILIFLLFHFIILIFFAIRFPRFTATFLPLDYYNMMMITVMSLIVLLRLVKLFKFYQINISEDYEKLEAKNLELAALNEEYYATQEELYEKYDEVYSLNRENERMAYQDVITGLYNRNAYFKYLPIDLEEHPEGLYVIFADVVRFRDINSAFGYEKGDALLQEIAGQLSELDVPILRIARFGADLFALIVSESMDVDAIVAILSGFRVDIEAHELTLAVRMKFGIVASSHAGSDIRKLFQAADLAINKAKATNGTTCHVFDEGLADQLAYNITIFNSLEQAVEKGDITTVFQPIVSAVNEEIIGYECLARWHDLGLGTISPEVFIRVAEETRLIIPMGKQILRHACQFARKLKEKGYERRVSVNLSSVQFDEEGFEEKLVSIIDEYGLGYDQIALEVTESDMMSDLDRVTEILNNLRKRGFLVYLDDFGTGYSSLSYLSRLPVDVLKVDRSFITDIQNNQQKQQMLQAILLLKSAFKLTIVAEGVEVIAEADYLKSMNIEAIQGFYYARPMASKMILEEL